MSPFRRQRLIEDRYDVILSVIGLALIFGLGWLLPRSWAWYWLIPLGLFWIRWNYVRVCRDERSRAAELAAYRRRCAANGEGSDGSVSLTDGIEQSLVPGEQPQPPRELLRIGRSQ
jgi:hypothetical protein